MIADEETDFGSMGPTYPLQSADVHSVTNIDVMTYEPKRSTNKRTPSSRVTKPSLRETQKALTRQRVIDAALELFHRQGFGSTTMEDIAVEANLNRGTIYHHFDSKAEILRSALDTGSEELVIFSAAEGARDRAEVMKVWSKTFDLWVQRLSPVWRPARDAATVDDTIRTWLDRVIAHQIRQTTAILQGHGVSPANARARATLLIAMCSEILYCLPEDDVKKDRGPFIEALADFFETARRV